MGSIIIICTALAGIAFGFVLGAVCNNHHHLAEENRRLREAGKPPVLAEYLQ
jgi:hypothetical protein